MSRIKDFKATEVSGIVGFLVTVEGEVNCGMLTVMPEITEAVPQGINPSILILEVMPAAESPEAFQKASFSKNESHQGQYKQVQLRDTHGHQLALLDVVPAGKQPH